MYEHHDNASCDIYWSDPCGYSDNRFFLMDHKTTRAESSDSSYMRVYSEISKLWMTVRLSRNQRIIKCNEKLSDRSEINHCKKFGFYAFKPTFALRMKAIITSATTNDMSPQLSPLAANYVVIYREKSSRQQN